MRYTVLESALIFLVLLIVSMGILGYGLMRDFFMGSVLVFGGIVILYGIQYKLSYT